MPQMAPVAWIYLFYFTIFIYALVSVKLFYTPSLLSNSLNNSVTTTSSFSSLNWLW